MRKKLTAAERKAIERCARIIEGTIACKVTMMNIAVQSHAYIRASENQSGIEALYQVAEAIRALLKEPPK